MYLYLAGTLTYYYKKGQKVESGREILEAEVDKFSQLLPFIETEACKSLS